MNPPSVYIITLNWNGLEDTLECLASLAELTYRSVKVIVVDNASRDGQAEQIEQQFPDVAVLKQTENLGFCGGCNVGIKCAIVHGADYVMLLNNDTLVPPDLIEKLLAGTDGLADAGAISPIILEYPDTEKVWFSNARWVASEAQFRLARPDDHFHDLAVKEPYVSEFACGCCLLVSTKVLQDVGLLDERYFAFYDEADWCARAKRIGLRSYVIPSAVMYHKVSRSTPGLVSTYLLTRNRLLWMKENLPLGERIRSFSYLMIEFVWHTCNLLGLTSDRFSRHHSRVVFRGYWDYFTKRFYKWSDEDEEILFPKS